MGFFNACKNCKGNIAEIERNMKLQDIKLPDTEQTNIKFKGLVIFTEYDENGKQGDTIKAVKGEDKIVNAHTRICLQAMPDSDANITITSSDNDEVMKEVAAKLAASTEEISDDEQDALQGVMG